MGSLLRQVAQVVVHQVVVMRRLELFQRITLLRPEMQLAAAAELAFHLPAVLTCSAHSA